MSTLTFAPTFTAPVLPGIGGGGGGGPPAAPGAGPPGGGGGGGGGGGPPAVPPAAPPIAPAAAANPPNDKLGGNLPQEFTGIEKRVDDSYLNSNSIEA